MLKHKVGRVGVDVQNQCGPNFVNELLSKATNVFATFGKLLERERSQG